MRVLSLNLHGYQEKEPVKKLQIIADSILENDIDIICFSECAQRYFTPIVDRNIKKDNAKQSEIVISKAELDSEMKKVSVLGINDINKVKEGIKRPRRQSV
mgnify:CR=1 FL=1